MIKFLLSLLLLASSANAFSVRPALPVAVSHHWQGMTPGLRLSKAASPIHGHLVRTAACTALSMSSSSSSTDDSSPPSSWFSQISLPYAALWVALIVFAFGLAPGSLDDPHDAALIQAVVENPVDPEGMNKLYYFVFNLFAIIPFSLACLVYPQASRKGMPAFPFVLGSAFVGYFALGPYMMFRDTSPEQQTDLSSLNWFTRNVLENKLFNYALVLLCAYLPFGSGAVEALLQADPSPPVQGFVDLVTTSRFASVSAVDLFLLSATAAALIPVDYRLRRPDATEQETTTIALSTMLLPVIGSAVYCAWRPELPIEEE